MAAGWWLYIYPNRFAGFRDTKKGGAVKAPPFS